MDVKLISWTRSPIETCAIAASMCYDSEPSRKIVKGCIKSKHLSILEHANFTFMIDGVSRSFLAQITRHRIASFSVQSQRYVQYDDVEFVPPVLKNFDIERTFNSSVKSALTDYKEMITSGANPEDARAVLPNAMPTKMVVTMNIRSMMNFMNERLCMNAQKEIRDVANAMKKCVLNCPDLTEEDREIINMVLVPKCEKESIPFCTERKCCGRHKKLAELVKES